MKLWGVVLSVVVGALLLGGCGSSGGDEQKTVVEGMERGPTETAPEPEVVPAEKQSQKPRPESDKAAAEQNQPKPKPAKEPKPHPEAKSPDTMAKTCNSWPPPEQSACELSYLECSMEARPIVKGYYEETGPDIGTVAEKHARDAYGHSGESEQSAELGCLAAFFDKYDELYPQE